MKYVLAALALSATVGQATAQMTWIEPVAGYARFKLEDGSDSTTADGVVVGLRGRVRVEGIWFASAEVQHAPLSGDVQGADYDFDYTLYRIGLGAQNDIGEGGANASVKAEFVHLDTETKNFAGGDLDDGQSGASFTLRFERNLVPGAVLLPYLEAAYIGLNDFDSVEGLLGLQLALRGPLRPFIEYRYIQFDGGSDLELVSSNVQAGLRWTFN